MYIYMKERTYGPVCLVGNQKKYLRGQGKRQHGTEEKRVIVLCSSILYIRDLEFLLSGSIFKWRCQKPEVTEGRSTDGERVGILEVESSYVRWPFPLSLLSHPVGNLYPQGKLASFLVLKGSLYVASTAHRINSNKMVLHLTQPREPIEGCVGNSGVIHF